MFTLNESTLIKLRLNDAKVHLRLDIEKPQDYPLGILKHLNFVIERKLILKARQGFTAG